MCSSDLSEKSLRGIFISKLKAKNLDGRIYNKALKFGLSALSGEEETDIEN